MKTEFSHQDMHQIAAESKKLSAKDKMVERKARRIAKSAIRHYAEHQMQFTPSALNTFFLLPFRKYGLVEDHGKIAAAANLLLANTDTGGGKSIRVAIHDDGGLGHDWIYSTVHISECEEPTVEAGEILN